MKRNLFILSTFLFSLVYYACQKNENILKTPIAKDSFVEGAVDFVRSKISDNEFQSLDLNSIELMKTDGIVTGIIILSKNNLSDNSIIIGKVDNKLIGNWVNYQNKGNGDNGILATTSFDRNLKNEVTFLDSRAVKIIKTDHGVSKTTYIKYPKEKVITSSENIEYRELNMGVQSSEIDNNPVNILPLVSVTAYKNSSVKFYSLYWCFNQNRNYLYTYNTKLPTSSGGTSGGGGSNSSNINAPAINSPGHPILNIGEEMKCFTISAGSTYSILVNINEPRPGTRDLVNVLNDHEVGHSFLTFEQDLEDGTKVIRNIGFYPKNVAKAGAAQDASVFGDDSNMPASVVLKITVNGSDFNSVVQNVIRQSSNYYHLDAYNCTTSVIKSLNSININLPSTIRYNNVLSPFTGNDPADLGADIRALNLNTFAQANGNRAIVRSVSNSNNIKPSKRTGNCVYKGG